MPKRAPVPNLNSKASADRVLFSSGFLCLGIALYNRWVTRQFRVANFVRPLVVQGGGVDPHIRRQGVGATCWPQFRYQIKQTIYLARPPVPNRYSCYRLGQTVTLTVDANQPERIADWGSEKSARFEWYGCLLYTSPSPRD